LSYDTFPYFFLIISPNKKRKEKEKKRNINNDLAILPSHNRSMSKKLLLEIKENLTQNRLKNRNI